MSNLMDLQREYRVTFLGACMGIGFKPRKEGDAHILIQILVEDDDNWFTSDQPFSSFWLPDLRMQIDEAQHWLECNAHHDVGGWRFKADDNYQQAIVS